MNKIILAFAACVIFSPLAAFAAPDPLSAAPDMYKLLFENDKVRVMEVMFKPGQKIAKHTHTHEHFVTVLEPGTLTIHKEDGTSTVNELKTEQVVWIPAETHWAENTGKSEVKLLVTEMKK
jgi:quercetin dioxygenase-like cupin family protein